MEVVRFRDSNFFFQGMVVFFEHEFPFDPNQMG